MKFEFCKLKTKINAGQFKPRSQCNGISLTKEKSFEVNESTWFRKDMAYSINERA